ncbi:MAG: peptide chain release factor N(5)-glutamine methyltransferase [Gemmatimonadaceae bacterium]|nr:peptide chain release factor N(5)-glutamine methyltransferase [Acetobacteraceae bacterium]
MRVADAWRHGAAVLAAAGVDTPRIDARLLMMASAGLTRLELLSDAARTIDLGPYDALLARRAAREPVALILGHQEFWSLSFEVSPDTLIPRADSETLISAALAVFPDRGRVRSVLDLGTGTGCLLLAALTEFPGAWGVGVDRSAAAAALAARNAASLRLAPRAAMLCGDWSAALSARFDLVFCNPPYIPTADIAGLMPEVADYEPGLALDGGADGLSAYRRVIAALPGLMAPGGAAVLELGVGQADAVADIAGRAVTLRPDLAGVPRALVLRS